MNFLQDFAKTINTEITQNHIEQLLTNVPKEIAVQFALECAKGLDQYYDTKKYPAIKKANDKCLELVEKYLINPKSVTPKELQDAADAAYKSSTTYASNTSNAADAAYYAAGAAYCAAYAANAAYYAADAAYYAAEAAYYAVNAADAACATYEGNSAATYHKTMKELYLKALQVVLKHHKSEYQEIIQILYL